MNYTQIHLSNEVPRATGFRGKLCWYCDSQKFIFALYSKPVRANCSLIMQNLTDAPVTPILPKQLKNL